jgi:hypothetical protein
MAWQTSLCATNLDMRGQLSNSTSGGSGFASGHRFSDAIQANQRDGFSR